MKNYEITCRIGEEVGWWFIRAIDEETALEKLNALVDEEIDEIIEIYKLGSD